MDKTKWVIEFQSGRYFQGVDIDDSGPLSSAQRFDTLRDVDAFMRANQWVTFAGGMAVEVPA